MLKILEAGTMAILVVAAFAVPVSARVDLCRQYVDSKDYDRAIDECSRMLTSPAYPADEAYNNRGIAYAGKKQYDLAVADYSRAIGLNPAFDKAFINRGNAYWHLGQYEKSFEAYKAAIKLNPDDPNAYYNMACRHALRNNEKEACTWLEKAVAKGFAQWELIKKDSDLDGIRGAACYKQILNGK